MDKFITALALACLAGTPANARAPAAPLPPPQVAAAPGVPAVQSARARHAMIATANPLATAAGLAVLKRGGSAVDAAVAVQAVLGLVEPQSSGLGGGAYMLYYDAATHRVTAYDGREVAPAGASPRQFIGANGQPISFAEAVVGGIATGVPGAIALLDTAQQEHGRLPWASLFAAAQQLATHGFAVSARLASFINGPTPEAQSPDAQAYFSHADGTPLVTGDILRNPAYAATLETIAARRSAGLLTGRIAADIVARVHQGPLPSTLTMADLAAYRVHEGEALCRPWQTYAVCTPQAPSGGPPLQEALGLLARTDAAARNANDPQAWYDLAEASRLAYADRDRYMGDPAFVTVPVAGLLARDYLDARARLIGETAAAHVTWGQPAGAPSPGADATREPGGTSHIVVVDTRGNAVSMTTTVENIFGSGRMVDGFFLNNQLTDFSFSPAASDGTWAANALAPGKRPRSSMAPVMVLKPSGGFLAAMGSPGGANILGYNLKAVLALLGWHLRPQQVAALPNLIAHGDGVVGDALPPAVMQGLAARGVIVAPMGGETSGLQVLMKRPDGSYEGGADPRREGLARGF